MVSNVVDVHPEHLLDAVRRATATHADLELVMRHCEACSACRLELWAIDADRQLRPPPPRAVESIVSSAMALIDDTWLESMAPAHPPAPVVHVVIRHAPTLEATPAAPLGSRVGDHAALGSRPLGSRTRAAFAGLGTFGLAAAAALVLVGIGSTAAAAYWVTQHVVHALERLEGAAQAPVEPEPPAPERARRARRVARPDPAPEVETQGPSAALVVVPPQADAIPSAAEFLERADRARQRGEHARAARLYRDLQHAHPGSREALVSRVSLARVHLDHLGNPRTALYHFDRYLRAGRDHSLDTEALAGRAEAYRRLGERENELEAWRAMIRQYPDSPAARRGQRRIAELSP